MSHPHIQTSGNELVDEVGDIKLLGNIVHAHWYRTIITYNKKGYYEPDHLAIAILSEIVYWYRPVLNQSDWSMRQKFKADLPQLSRSHFAKKFNVSPNAISQALKRLKKLGVIETELRLCHKMERLFIRIIPDVLRKLSTGDDRYSQIPAPEPGDSAPSTPESQLGTPRNQPQYPQCEHTDITPNTSEEISTKITTSDFKVAGATLGSPASFSATERKEESVSDAIGRALEQEDDAGGPFPEVNHSRIPAPPARARTTSSQKSYDNHRT